MAEHAVPSPNWESAAFDSEYFDSDWYDRPEDWSEDETEAGTSQGQGGKDKDEGVGKQKTRRKRTPWDGDKKKDTSRASNEKTASSQGTRELPVRSRSNPPDAKSAAVDPAPPEDERGSQAGHPAQNHPANKSEIDHAFTAKAPTLNTASRTSQDRSQLSSDPEPQPNSRDQQGVQLDRKLSADEERRAKEEEK